MEILERCLDAKDPAKVLLAEPSLITDDFSLGLISSFYRTNPNLENAESCIFILQKLDQDKRARILLIFLEILIKLLHTSNKQEMIAQIFENLSVLLQELNSPAVDRRLVSLFDALLERVSCETGLKLFRLLITSLKFPHPFKEFTETELTHLDISIVSSLKVRFQAAIKACTICQNINRFTVLNALAFQCIEYVLRYELADISPYLEVIETNLNRFNPQFSYEQRLKLSRLYQDIANKISKPISRETVDQLEALKFSDSECTSPNQCSDFTYLIEDVLQFDLSDQIIRERIKSLHGRYKGTLFVEEILAALRAIAEDEPGYKAMDRISAVLKPLKLLSKKEYQRYKRNEKKIMYAGDKAVEDLKILEPALVNIPRVHEYLSGIFYTPETRGSNLEEIRRGLAAQVTEMHSDAVIEVFGSFLTETWVEASSIDVSINSSSIKDTYSFIVALKSKLVQSTEVEVVRSKSLPMIRYRVLNGDRWVNVTINNATAGNTEVVAKYCKLNRKVGELIRVVKLWARSVQLIGTGKGFPSGYEWSLIVIGFLQSLGAVPALDVCREGEGENEIVKSLEELFAKFLFYCHRMEKGDTINIVNGTVEKEKEEEKEEEKGKGKKNQKRDMIFSILNPGNGKIIGSRIKRERKQGKLVKLMIENTILRII